MLLTVESSGITPAPTVPIRVLIAEDHFITRVGIETIVAAQPDMAVIGSAINGAQALSLYRAQLPDVTLMDMYMPSDGFSAVAAIRAEFPQARIIALSTFAADEDIRRAMNAGAQIYLTKDVLHDELITAIRTVHAGEKYIFAPVQAALASQTPHADLSKRELEVLGFIARGLSNKLIAYELGIAEYTINNHVKSILKKLSASDRTAAVTHALQRGILRL
jgi:two-component system, NarL family, response regulator